MKKHKIASKALSLLMVLVMMLTIMPVFSLIAPLEALAAESGTSTTVFTESNFGHFGTVDANQIRSGQAGGASFQTSATAYWSGRGAGGSNVASNRAFLMRFSVPQTEVPNLAWIDSAVLNFSVIQSHNTGGIELALFTTSVALPATLTARGTAVGNKTAATYGSYRGLAAVGNGPNNSNADNTDANAAMTVNVTDIISSGGVTAMQGLGMLNATAANPVRNFEFQALVSAGMLTIAGPSHATAARRPRLVIEWSEPTVGDVSLPASVENAHQLPAELKGESIAWAVAEADAAKADMFNPANNTITAQALTTSLTLVATLNDESKEMTTSVTGILDGISLPDSVVFGYKLPSTSFGLPITWTAVPPEALEADGLTVATMPEASTPTFSAHFGGVAKGFAMETTPEPPKTVTFTGNEWAWLPTGSSMSVTGNGINPFQVGSENSRSRYFMYDTKQKALDYFTMYPLGFEEEDELWVKESDWDSPSEWYLNLNGTWKFRYDKAPRNRVWPVSSGADVSSYQTTAGGVNNVFGLGANATRNSAFPKGVFGFNTTETYNQRNDDSAAGTLKVWNGWNDITVPGNWQVNFNADGSFMYDRPLYRNHPLPFAQNNMGYQLPTGINQNGNSMTFGTGNQNANAWPNMPNVSNGVGTYQRDIVIPATWNGKRVFLNLDGADSFYVWVDGVPIGFSECKYTHAEFDVTDALMSRGSIAGTHTITVQVIRWAIGSNYEGQDFIDISGIFRNIYLMARNNEDIWDFQIDPRPASVAALNAGNATDWTLNVKTAVRDFADHLKASGTSKTVHYELYDADGLLVGSGSGAGDYFMQETNLTMSGYNATFGGGVRWDANQPDRTARNTTSASISIAKPAPFEIQIPAAQAKLWSSESPYLYKLVLWVDNGADTEYTAVRVGLRYVDYQPGAATTAGRRLGRLLVNGTRVTFYGANIHETNPETGHAMTLGLIRKDLETMKLLNLNGMRLAHYPHESRYYDLADELGLYIVDEANNEQHWSAQSGATGIVRWTASFPIQRDRMLKMFERDKNYPSVVVWSCGNESGSLDAASALSLTAVLERREADFTGRGSFNAQGVPNSASGSMLPSGRPSHYGESSGHSQIYGHMYDTPSTWRSNMTSTSGGTGGKPAFLNEYSHAQGNSNGNLDSYIETFENYNNAVGGFIWDYVDQSIWVPFSNFYFHTTADIAASGRSGFLSYGGNWGEMNYNTTAGGSFTDEDFTSNGILLADRTVKPQGSDVKYHYQRIKTTQNGTPTANSVGYAVKNMNMFTNVNAYDMTWQILENGIAIREGSDVLNVAPIPAGPFTNVQEGNKHTTANFTAYFDEVTPKPNAEYYFHIRFHLRDALSWADAGYVIAENQIRLSSADFLNPAKPTPPVSIAGITVIDSNPASATSGTYTITGPVENGVPKFEYVFNKSTTTPSGLSATGQASAYGRHTASRFTEMKYEGKLFATHGPEPDFYRAPIPNEWRGGSRGAALNTWLNVGVQRARQAATVIAGDNCVIITAPYGANATSGSRFTSGTTVYTIFPDGEMKVEQTVVFPNVTTASGGNTIGEIGSEMVLVPGLDNITYHGRGPDENYVDRRHGSMVGIYETTVADNFTEYITAQTTGNRIDTRWVALTDDSGFGLLVKSGEFAANNLFRTSTAQPVSAPYNASSLIEFNALYFHQAMMSGIGVNGARNTRRNANSFNTFRSGNRNEPGNPIFLSLNVAGRGVGGDNTWGADTHVPYQINATNQTVNYNYTIKPVSDFNVAQATDYSREIRNPFQSVKDLMPVALAAGVPAADPAYVAADALTSGANAVVASQAYKDLVEAMAALKPVIVSASALGFSAVPDANGLISIHVPQVSILNSVTPTFEVFAAGDYTISPTGPQDFEAGPVQYTVTSGGVSNTYFVQITSNADACAIIFSANGGTGTMLPGYVLSGEDYLIPDNAFARANHAFAGWNTAANGTGTKYASGETITNLQGNITLFAQWTRTGVGIGPGPIVIPSW